jgi:beta-N-acetylhexosaminidase
LRPPQWRALPSASAYAALFDTDASIGLETATAVARLTAEDLREIGVNTNCAPVLDLRIDGAHDIIGDRAYGREPSAVAALGRAVANGYAAGGVLPVIKHIPGHGRALADSHLELPVVTTSRAELEATDFAPFRLLAEQPAAMTAHVVYASVDPVRPASTSAIVTRDIIRGLMGFDGLLMSDDLSMRALSGGLAERAAAVISAGSDVALHCNGNMDEMREVAAATPVLDGRAAERLERCFVVTRSTAAYDRRRAEICWRLAMDAETAGQGPFAAKTV